MAWHPKTLRDALDSGEVVETAYDPETTEILVQGYDWFAHSLHGRLYPCSLCATKRKAELLIDIRSLPITGTFVCDNCTSGWERRGEAVDGNPAPIPDVVEWRRRWAAALNAPQAIFDKLDTLRPQPSYGRHRGIE